jgi:syntaxin 5
LENIF